MRTGAYPEFTVPGYSYTDSKGRPTSIKLFFDRKTFEQVAKTGIEIRQQGQSEGPVTVRNFWDEIQKIAIEGGKPQKNEVAYRPDLRDSKGRFVSKAKQAQVIQDMKGRGIRWESLSDKKQKALFRDSSAVLSIEPILEEFDRTTIRQQVEQAYALNPNYIVEIKGTDTKSRAYTSRESALRAIDQQLNKFYQGGSKFQGRAKKG
jgi:hypothetical protein